MHTTVIQLLDPLLLVFFVASTVLFVLFFFVDLKWWAAEPVINGQ